MFASRKDLRPALIPAFLLASAVAAQAQSAVPPAQPATPAAAPAASANSTVINLIQQLVQEGVLTQDRAQALIHQAQDEAAVAARGVPAVAPGAAPAPSVRVPYIPQVVRNQLRDEVKQEVLREAREQNWAQPNQVPEWTKRFHLNGDFRLRYEWNLFDNRNSNAFPNFAALNAGANAASSKTRTESFWKETLRMGRIVVTSRAMSNVSHRRGGARPACPELVEGLGRRRPRPAGEKQLDAPFGMQP